MEQAFLLNPKNPRKPSSGNFLKPKTTGPGLCLSFPPHSLAVLLCSFCTARLRSACGLHPQPDPGGLGRVTEPSCVPVASLDFVVPWSSLSSCSGLSCPEERRLSIPPCPHSSPLYRTVLPQKGLCRVHLWFRIQPPSLDREAFPSHLGLFFMFQMESHLV